MYTITLNRQTFAFKDLKTVFAKASHEKSGDGLAGIQAQSAQERVAAKRILSETTLEDIAENPLIPYEEDEVTRLICESHDLAAFQRIRGMTVGEFREFLLAHTTTTEHLQQLAWAITPEMAAGVSKLMRNQDLITVAKKCSVVTQFRTTLGLPGRFSTRLQPNHPTDDPKGILASTLDGLLLGIGDAVIGINPALDQMESISGLLYLLDDLRTTLHIPTQSCVLTHVTHQLAAIERGVPVDLIFQSIAGSERANHSMGVNGNLISEAHEAGVSLRRGTGQNVMYFETGQGSALSANAHWNVDQQTLEARAYGFARLYQPYMVNTVVGFIGPEYLFNGKQIIRAGLEDHFCGKLLGLPMGVDICYTNHAQADQDDMDVLLTLLAASGVNFIMGVPGSDDIMLHYQSSSFHDTGYVRDVFGLRPAPEFETWLEHMQITQGGQLTSGKHPTERLLGSMGLEKYHG